MDLHDSTKPLVAALGFGVIHALTPCAHSWPVLLPLAARTRTGARPGFMFGAGMFASSFVVGALIGGLGHLINGRSAIVVENIIGGAVILLGGLLALRPQWMHGGHMHGTCSPAPDGKDEPHCDHATHHPRRFARFGSDFGAILLGIANMALPCWSNVMGVTLTVDAGSAAGGAVVLGCYGFAAALTTIAILVLFRQGLRLTERLASPRVENALLRITGWMMVAYGLTLLLHLGHDHSH
jgi:nickel/cobalt exporter